MSLHPRTAAETETAINPDKQFTKNFKAVLDHLDDDDATIQFLATEAGHKEVHALRAARMEAAHTLRETLPHQRQQEQEKTRLAMATIIRRWAMEYFIQQFDEGFVWCQDAAIRLTNTDLSGYIRALPLEERRATARRRIGKTVNAAPYNKLSEEYDRAQEVLQEKLKRDVHMCDTILNVKGNTIMAAVVTEESINMCSGDIPHLKLIIGAARSVMELPNETGVCSKLNQRDRKRATEEMARIIARTIAYDDMEWMDEKRGIAKDLGIEDISATRREIVKRLAMSDGYADRGHPGRVEREKTASNHRGIIERFGLNRELAQVLLPILYAHETPTDFVTGIAAHPETPLHLDMRKAFFDSMHFCITDAISQASSNAYRQRTVKKDPTAKLKALIEKHPELIASATEKDRDTLHTTLKANIRDELVANYHGAKPEEMKKCCEEIARIIALLNQYGFNIETAIMLQDIFRDSFKKMNSGSQAARIFRIAREEFSTELDLASFLAEETAEAHNPKAPSIRFSLLIFIEALMKELARMSMPKAHIYQIIQAALTEIPFETNAWKCGDIQTTFERMVAILRAAEDTDAMDMVLQPIIDKLFESAKRNPRITPESLLKMAITHTRLKIEVAAKKEFMATTARAAAQLYDIQPPRDPAAVDAPAQLL